RDRLDHNAVRRTLGVIAFCGDFGPCVNSVADEYGLHESQAVVAVRHRTRIDLAGGHAYAYAEDQRAMCDPLSEVLRCAPGRVHMVGEKIPGLPGVCDDVRFGDGSPESFTGLAQRVVFKILFVDHAIPSE